MRTLTIAASTILALVVAGDSRVARAQPGSSAALHSGPTLTKSPWVATGWAFGVTAAGLAIGGVADGVDTDASSPITLVAFAASYLAVTAGPSAGHWYAGERSHAIRWSAIRFGGLAAAGGGIYLAFDAYQDDRALVPGVLLAGAGTAAFAVGLYWDLFDAHRAANRANRRAGLGATATVTIVPLGSSGAGMVFSGSF
jgi:hypothetical protein